MYFLLSGLDGLFFSTKIPQGVYKLTKVMFTMTSSGRFTVTHTNPERIEIVNGKVNNLGTISGVDTGPYIQYDWNREYTQVRNLFMKEYSSSNWNEKEWINTGINRTNSSGNIPASTLGSTPVTRPVPSQPSTAPLSQTVALKRAAEEAIKNVQQRSRMAIVYITAPDKSMTDYITGELEYIWVNAGYIYDN